MHGSLFVCVCVCGCAKRASVGADGQTQIHTHTHMSKKGVDFVYCSVAPAVCIVQSFCFSSFG